MDISLRHPGAAATAGAAVIAIGLAIDVAGGVAGQIAASVLAWAIALAIIERATGELRVRLLACLVIATAGELFLSLVWGLYDYRLYNIPPFVPPGHVLLMFAGLVLAERRLPAGAVAVTLALGAAWAGYALWSGRSTLDVVLFAAFAACIVLARSRHEVSLYVCMFWLTLVLELYGTALGCWVWRPRETWFGLTSTNPPLIAAAFYCVLDLLSLRAAALARGGLSLPGARVGMRG